MVRSIYRFEGQVTVFHPGTGRYRCLYPSPPPPELAPSCAEGGVLGVLPGIVGSLQASEALKLVLGEGDTLAGRLLLFDALGTTFDEVAIRRNPEAPSAATPRRSPSTSTTSSSAQPCRGRTRDRRPDPPTLGTRSAARHVEARGATIRELLDDLVERHPALGSQILANGGIAPFVNVYLRGEDVRTLDGLDTAVTEGDTVILLPAMAGGAPTPPPRGSAAELGRLHAARAPRPCSNARGRAALPVARACSTSEGRRSSSSGGSPPGRGVDLREARRAEPHGIDQDRVAKSIEAAEASGELEPGRALLEPTSGNTGISLALVAALKGYPLTCVMPRNATERRRLLRLYGADIVSSPAPGRARTAPSAWRSRWPRTTPVVRPVPVREPANPRAHYEGTAPRSRPRSTGSTPRRWPARAGWAPAVGCARRSPTSSSPPPSRCPAIP